VTTPESHPEDGGRARSRRGFSGRVAFRWQSLIESPRASSLHTQTATGLTPGKVYTLQFITADYTDMVEGRIDPKQLGLTAVLGAGAQVIPEKSYVFVDRRNSGRKKDDGLVRVNLHHVRFRAVAPSFTVTFTDAEAEPGTQTALNYIMLKPYFEQ